MTARYRIRAGERFVQPDGKILTGGDMIELPDDLAVMHAPRIETIAVTSIHDDIPVLGITDEEFKG